MKISKTKIYVTNFLISMGASAYSVSCDGFDRHHILDRRLSQNRLVRRELPQEWSHKQIVDIVNIIFKKNNPLGIVDVIYSLLGEKGAKEGAGKFDKSKIVCMKKYIADQAFTNAIKDHDLKSAAAAIKFAALERNSILIGVLTPDCTDTTSFVNPEIASIISHQDPAAEGAKETNRKSTLSVAKSLRMIGADPYEAIEVGTFAPGSKEDKSGKGNTCDDDKDPKGCINTKGLLVKDVTEDEIFAHVKDVKPAR